MKKIQALRNKGSESHLIFLGFSDVVLRPEEKSKASQKKFRGLKNYP